MHLWSHNWNTVWGQKLKKLTFTCSLREGPNSCISGNALTTHDQQSCTPSSNYQAMMKAFNIPLRVKLEQKKKSSQGSPYCTPDSEVRSQSAGWMPYQDANTWKKFLNNPKKSTRWNYILEIHLKHSKVIVIPVLVDIRMIAKGSSSQDLVGRPHRTAEV